MTPDRKAKEAWERIHKQFLTRGRIHSAASEVRKEPSAFVHYWLQRRLAEYDMHRLQKVGAAFFPAVFDPPLNGAVGGLWRVSVYQLDGREADHAVDARFRRGVQKGIEAAKTVHRVPVHGLRVEVRPDLGPVVGESLDVAVAVATYSALTQLAVPKDVAFTGVLDGQAHDVLRLAEKRAVVDTEWGLTARLAVVGADAERCDRFDSLGALLMRHFGPLPTPPTGQSLKARLERYLNASESEATGARAMELLIDSKGKGVSAPLVYRVAAKGVRAANHAGESELATKIARDVAEIAPYADASDRALLEASVGIAFIDRGDPRAAVAHLGAVIDQSPAGPAIDSTGDGRILQLYGTLARALSAVGDDQGALHYGKLACRVAPLEDRYRSAGDLALWQLRAGAPLAALLTLEAAADAVEADPDAAPDAETRAFHGLFRTRVLLALGRTEEALEGYQSLDGSKDLSIRIGHLELGVCLGLDMTQRLAKFDADLAGLLAKPGIVSRYRARIELARGQSADFDAIERWSGGVEPGDLARKVPY